MKKNLNHIFKGFLVNCFLSFGLSGQAQAQAQIENQSPSQEAEMREPARVLKTSDWRSVKKLVRSKNESNWPAEAQKIKAIEILGNRKIEKDAILTKLTSKVGGGYSSLDVREDVLSLMNLGYFSNVTVERDVFGKEVVLYYTVTEKPSIAEIKVDGNTEIKSDEIIEASGLKVYEIFNQAKLTEASEKIQKFYEDKGYFLARINIKPEVIKPNETVRLLVNVIENDKVKVKKITFLGAKQIPEGTLKGVMITQEGGFFSALGGSGQYKQEAFEQDLKVLRFLYYSKGYVRSVVERPQIFVTPDKRSIYVTIRIEEGNQYDVGEVDFAGDLLFPKEELFNSIQINKNGLFAYDVLQKDVSELAAKYGDLGYAYANVLPRTRIDDETRKVDVIFEFDKGNKVYFGKINVVGNTKTRDKVVRRELRIHEGELYNETARRKSQEGIQRLGFFEEVSFKTSTDPEKMDIMNVDVVVKERNTGQISLAASYGTATGFGMQGSIQEMNFLGKGQNLGASLQFMAKTSDASISFTEPYYNDTLWSVGYELFRKTNQNRDAYDEYRLGGAVTLGHPFDGIEELRYSVRLKSETTSLTGKDINGLLKYRDPELFDLDKASGQTNSIMGAVTYDTRNDRFSPSKGIFVSLSYENTGLGGNIHFQRYNGIFRFFKGLFWDVVWRNSMSYAHIDSLDPSKDPPFTELYLLGGPYSLRGYRMFRVGRTKFSKGMKQNYLEVYPGKEAQADVYATQMYGGTQQALYQTELQFPLIKEASMFGVVFFDAGAADDHLDANRVYSDWGFGMRWFSPIGPLRFELGFPLTFDEQYRESGIFEFSIGAPF